MFFETNQTPRSPPVDKNDAMRRPSDLERWHQQLAAAKPTAPAPRPQRPRAATAAVATVAAELMSVTGPGRGGKLGRRGVCGSRARFF